MAWFVMVGVWHGMIGVWYDMVGVCHGMGMATFKNKFVSPNDMNTGLLIIFIALRISGLWYPIRIWLRLKINTGITK